MIRVARLRERFPLGPAWSEPAVVVDVVHAAGVTLHRVALSATSTSGREVTGAGAALQRPPLRRAYFELLERASTLDALVAGGSFRLYARDGRRAGRCRAKTVFLGSADPSGWRYSLSNGIAIHRTARAARERALWELVERDRFLRSWYGLSTPAPFEATGLLPPGVGYDWRACLLPAALGRRWEQGIHAAVVLGFPRSRAMPLVRGFAARPTRRGAVAAAARECLQGLAFLWGEEIPRRQPRPTPTPGYHLERFLLPRNHQLLRDWLAGAHARYRERASAYRDTSSRVRFADLTPPALRRRAHVAKALCDDALPLVFGADPLATHLPARLRAHPIA